MTDDEINAEIERLEQLLNAGVSTVSSDGESVSIDADSIRRRLRTLRGQLSGSRHTQRRVRTLDLRRAF